VVRQPGRGESPLVLHLDVTDEAEVERVFAEGETRSAAWTCWSTTRGSRPGQADDQYSLEEWRRVITVNVEGVFLCTRAVIR